MAIKEHELVIDVLSLKKAMLILRAANHPLRQRMLQLLHHNKKLTVTEIYVKLRLEQSVASQHLAIMRKAGLVATEQAGKHRIYSVNYGRLDEVQQVSRQLLSMTVSQPRH